MDSTALIFLKCPYNAGRDACWVLAVHTLHLYKGWDRLIFTVNFACKIAVDNCKCLFVRTSFLSNTLQSQLAFTGGGSLLTSLHAVSHFRQPIHRVRSTKHPKASGGAFDSHALRSEVRAVVEIAPAPMILKKFRRFISINPPSNREYHH